MYCILVDSSLCVGDSNTKANFNTVLGLNCWNSLTGRVFLANFLEKWSSGENDKNYEFCHWKSDFVRFVLSDSRKHVERTSSTSSAQRDTSSTRRARKADRQKIPKSEVFCRSCNFFSEKGVFFQIFPISELHFLKTVAKRQFSGIKWLKETVGKAKISKHLRKIPN